MAGSWQQRATGPEQLQPNPLTPPWAPTTPTPTLHLFPARTEGLLCVCGGGGALVTRTMSVIRSPGAIIDPHLLSRVRQLLNVGAPPS